MASLYSNENIPIALVEALRAIGHDVLTSYDAGQANRRVSDDEVLSYAIREQRCVLTFNRRDFRRLHRQTSGAHAGIIACTPDPDYAAQAKRIHDAISAESGNLAGKELRVNRPG